MSAYRIALANIRFPATPEESVVLARQAIEEASGGGANIICFPECFVPGYRTPEKILPAPDLGFLEHAWSEVARFAAKANVAVVLGTERFADGALFATVMVINRDGTIAGFQDKVQLDASEEDIYSPGYGRQVFRCGSMTFGVVICHEGWRYPETVRATSLPFVTLTRSADKSKTRRTHWRDYKRCQSNATSPRTTSR